MTPYPKTQALFNIYSPPPICTGATGTTGDYVVLAKDFERKLKKSAKHNFDYAHFKGNGYDFIRAAFVEYYLEGHRWKYKRKHPEAKNGG